MKAIILGLAAFLTLQQAHADWKIQKSGFKATKAIKIKTGKTQEMDELIDMYDNSSAMANRVELQGTITIKEYDEDTFSNRTTVIQNVYVKLESYGLLLRAGNILDTYFPLKGLKGKPISAIFDSNFYGGKIGAGVELIFGVYPNYSFLMNDAGIRIPNIETWIGPYINIGVEAGYVSMDFKKESQGAHGKNNVTITSGDPNSNQQIVKKVELEDVLNRVVGQ